VAAHQFVSVVQFRAGQKVEADGVDDHADRAALYDQVVGLDLLVQLEPVLETAASPRQHGNAECGFGGLLRLLDDFGDSGGGSIGDGKLFHAGKIGACVAELKRFRQLKRKGAGCIRVAMFAPPPLAAYAVSAATSRGRLHHEPEAETRSPWQRDRDRIIHSSAFRKLQYKTQVFVNHEGDFYRTRLTHSIEVAQVARSIARALGLDEDLTEALALAHDLGHPPFGHAGEDALNVVMKPFGGFDHNAQSLRVVTLLESRYAGWDGLNLTWETLEGLVKHNGPLRNAAPYIADYNDRHKLDLHTQPSAEAQVAAIADDVAYHSHDLDDGLRARLFAVDDLKHLPVVGEALAAARLSSLDVPPPRLRHEMLRRVINAMVSDLIGESRKRLAKLDPGSPDAIRRSKQRVVSFGAAMADANQAIKGFLFARMYRHWRVNRMSAKAKRLTEDLYRLLHADPSLLPDDWRARAGEPGMQRSATIVGDYVAGMTDRYAMDEYRRLTDVSVNG
jgi:dGTPase